MSAVQESTHSAVVHLLLDRTTLGEVAAQEVATELDVLFSAVWQAGAEAGMEVGGYEGEGLSALTNPFKKVLPHGRYYDGTYEWEYDEYGWTPLRAPSGMPSEPTLEKLQRVVISYEPL